MKSNWFSGIGSSLGSFFGVFCPACVPAMAAVFSAIGLGFLINMKILGPLTALFLGLGIFGLYSNYKKHNVKIYLIIGIIASVMVYASRYVVEFNPVLYLGAGVLIGNAIFDYKKAKSNKSCPVNK